MGKIDSVLHFSNVGIESGKWLITRASTLHGGGLWSINPHESFEKVAVVKE